MLEKDQLNNDFMGFLKGAPTPYHAVESMVSLLKKAGFKELKEGVSFPGNPGPGKYYIVRGGSSLAAFKFGKKPLVEAGLRMAGAHTDSPCLKLKPKGEIKRYNYLQSGVEIYGGVLLSTWFDRDLSLAGRVNFKNKSGKISSALIDLERPIAVLPNLAIHLNPEANENRTIHRHREMPPLLFQWKREKAPSWDDFCQILADEGKIPQFSELLDMDLSFYDTQAPALVGLKGDFLCGARLDNLLSCYVGLQALIQSKDGENMALVLNDHEEVGSTSALGAQGPFFRSLLSRFAGGEENFYRSMHHSMMLSCDNAHGVHPNYPDTHGAEHAPLLNGGVAIKTNANQRYATSGNTAGFFRWLSDKEGLPVQDFVARSDMRCGSTIGPITASILGAKTLDLGVPTFAMHSVRETAGSADLWNLWKGLKSFYEYSGDLGEI